MKRQGPMAFEVPVDLWEAFEANAPASGPLPHLRLVLEDILARPQVLTKTLDKLLKSPDTRSKTMVVKGVRWPQELRDDIDQLSDKLHTTKVGVIRLAMEHDLN